MIKAKLRVKEELRKGKKMKKKGQLVLGQLGQIGQLVLEIKGKMFHIRIGDSM